MQFSVPFARGVMRAVKVQALVLARRCCGDFRGFARQYRPELGPVGWGSACGRLLSQRVHELSPQLYIQLKCQVVLMDFAIPCGTLYFVQRFPRDLGRYRWRIDQKNSTKTEYEIAFEMLTPAWLQSFSLERPFRILEGADYSAFRRFDYPEGCAPTYLKTVYGINVRGATNIGQLVREDLKFVDSQRDHGVQIADFLASGLRRCLRGGFKDNQQAARLLGGLMPRAEMTDPPIKLLGLTRVWWTSDMRR